MYRERESTAGLASIIIPVRNEEWCIAPLMQKISQIDSLSKFQYEIIFVDGNSTDNTCEKIEAFYELGFTVKLVRLSMDFGITQAIIAGIENSNGEYVVTIDGNLQNNPEDIPKMLLMLADGSDVCLGWRQSEENGALTRELPSKWYNKLVSWVTGIEFHDHECSLKAYRFTCLEGMGIYGNLHHYIHIYASMYGARLCEVPISQFPRAHGHGGQENILKRGVKRVLDLILLGFFTRYAQRPLYVFGSLGLFSLFLALLTFILMLGLRFSGTASFIETPLPTVTIAFGMTGVLLILIGVLSEFVVRIYFDARNQRFYRIKNSSNSSTL